MSNSKQQDVVAHLSRALHDSVRKLGYHSISEETLDAVVKDYIQTHRPPAKPGTALGYEVQGLIDRIDKITQATIAAVTAGQTEIERMQAAGLLPPKPKHGLKVVK